MLPSINTVDVLICFRDKTSATAIKLQKGARMQRREGIKLHLKSGLGKLEHICLHDIKGKM